MARKPIRLPKRFPVGTKYIVEGTSTAEGGLQVTRRYVLLPSGRTVDLPTETRPASKPAAAPPIVPRSARVLPPKGRAQRTPVRVAV